MSLQQDLFGRSRSRRICLICFFYPLFLGGALLGLCSSGCSSEEVVEPGGSLVGPFDYQIGFELVPDPGELGAANSLSVRFVPLFKGGGHVNIRGTSGGNEIGYFVDDPDVGFGSYLERVQFEPGVPIEVSCEVYLRGDIDIASINAYAFYDSLFVDDEIGYISSGEISEFFGYSANGVITGHIYIKE